MKDPKQLSRWILASVAGATLGALISIVQSCASNPAPAGIVYPQTRADVPRAVAVQIESTGRWIWEISANNNQTIARSEQDFESAPAALENYRDVRASMIAWPDAEVTTLKL